MGWRGLACQTITKRGIRLSVHAISPQAPAYRRLIRHLLISQMHLVCPPLSPKKIALALSPTPYPPRRRPLGLVDGRTPKDVCGQAISKPPPPSALVQKKFAFSLFSVSLGTVVIPRRNKISFEGKRGVL